MWSAQGSRTRFCAPVLECLFKKITNLPTHAEKKVVFIFSSIIIFIHMRHRAFVPKRTFKTRHRLGVRRRGRMWGAQHAMTTPHTLLNMAMASAGMRC